MILRVLRPQSSNFPLKVVTNFLFLALLATCTEIAPIDLKAGERNIPVQVTYLLVGRKEILNSFTLTSVFEEGIRMQLMV